MRPCPNRLADPFWLIWKLCKDTNIVAWLFTCWLPFTEGLPMFINSLSDLVFHPSPRDPQKPFSELLQDLGRATGMRSVVFSIWSEIDRDVGNICRLFQMDNLCDGLIHHITLSSLLWEALHRNDIGVNQDLKGTFMYLCRDHESLEGFSGFFGVPGVDP